jgi:hypothetical protein
MDTDDAYVTRQIHLFCQAIERYRATEISLNSLVLNLEALSSAISRKSWTSGALPLINHLEEINAVALSVGRKVTPDERSAVERLLLTLEVFARDFSGKLNSDLADGKT